MMGAVSYVDVLAGSVAVYIIGRYIASRPKYPLPPGPKPKPIIGNLLDIPKPDEKEWIHWAKHKELYGPISSVTVFGQTIVILNDLQIAIDLLDKKSSIFSERPVLVFAGIMVGWENCLALLHYGQRFKQIRKNLHQTIGSNNAMRRFYPQEEVEVRRFLYKTMRDPSKLFENIRNVTGALILSISHGYQIEHLKPDPMVELGEKTLLQFSLAAETGKWIVDFLPFLRFLPEWLPGIGFKRTGAEWAHVADELIEKPHAFAKQQVARGTARPSLTKQLLEECKDAPTPEEEYIIKYSAGAVYGGGADTTVTATYGFYLTLLNHPEVQRAAQAEIDSVIGPDRLPTFADRPNLPYINALVKETLRYCLVVPMGLPHVASEDCVFNGYYIPKGSIIQANIWQFLHDPEIYKDPHAFRPERFLGEHPEPDPHHITFGFGRRICPGKELADHTLYLTLAMSLAVFDVSWPLDDSGNPIVTPIDFSPGLIAKPANYSALFTPRSPKAESLINSITIDQPFEKGDSDLIEGIKWTKQPSPFPSWY
ncbi:hypothetical protein ACEPAF_5656 [Sanghuangporus sanghuang]